MARTIVVHHPDGSLTTHTLSVARFTTLPDGRVKDLSIAPFTRETPGTLYHDTPLHLYL